MTIEKERVFGTEAVCADILQRSAELLKILTHIPVRVRLPLVEALHVPGRSMHESQIFVTAALRSVRDL